MDLKLLDKALLIKTKIFKKSIILQKIMRNLFFNEFLLLIEFQQLYKNPINTKLILKKTKNK